MFKRLVDIVFSASGLFFLSPFFVLTAVGNKIFSPGPIFFTQKRVGKDGNLFKIIKFRTMVVDADKNGGISIGGDPRNTAFGRLLRLTKIDELPQLWNVLKGEMSLIGPRPELPEIVSHYTTEQKRILTVRPGMVGPAQIIGRNEEEMLPSDVQDAQDFYIRYILPDKLKVDLNYIDNCSLSTDFRLLVLGIKETVIGTIKPNSLIGKNPWPTLFFWDMVLASCSYILAYCLRFDWSIPEAEFQTMLQSLSIVLGFRALAFLYFKLYRTLYKYLSIRDVMQILQAVLLSSGAIIIGVFYFGLGGHSRSIFIIDSIILIMAMGGLRCLLRLLSERPTASSYTPHINILIVGAGDVGEMAVRDLAKNGHLYKIVGFIDDDPKKQGLHIHGYRVLGNRAEIPDLVQTLRVDEVLIAVSKISSTEMRSILNYCDKAQVKYRMIPAVSDLVSGKIQLAKIRNVDISDLLGRDTIHLDLTAIRSFIHNKRVVVTGAGGSIGAELCRQIAGYAPAQMILIDRSENYLYELGCELGKYSDSRVTKIFYLLGDILDRRKMAMIFKTRKPDIVFHAAAQKHVPFGESNADEAVKNNIQGTKIIALASHHYRVGYFVFISTDKAVNPTSVMGATKRVAEMFLQSLAQKSSTNFITVRFGNVLNSHGSVVPLFLEQIRSGGPITVTDSRVQRYFMSIPEAVNLILQAVIMGSSGDIYILEMGKLIRIEDLAREMIKQAGMKPGNDIKIVYTGLRPGEKIYEELVSQNEISLATSHPLVRRIIQKAKQNPAVLDSHIIDLEFMARRGDQKAIVQKLNEIIPEFPTTAMRTNEKRLRRTRPKPVASTKVLVAS